MGTHTCIALMCAHVVVLQEHRLRTHVFVTDTIPLWISALGYLSFGIVGCLVIPHVYPAGVWHTGVTSCMSRQHAC
jgi:hypothetical protein